MESSNRIILVLLFGLLVWSCSSKIEESTINIIEVNLKEAQEVNLSIISSKVEYIALETTSDNLISQIQEIEHNDEFIFISDLNSLYQFSIDGSFIKKIGTNGLGPGEFQTINGLAVDWEKRHIYLATMSNQKLICLDFNGRLIKEVKLVLWVDGLQMINGNLGMISTAMGQPSSKKDFRKSITYRIDLSDDLTLGDSTVIRSVNVPMGYGSATPRGMSFLSEANGKEFAYFPVVYKESMVRDTLYQIVENKRVPHTKVDFGIKDRLNSALFINSIFRTDQYLIAEYGIKGKFEIALVHLPTMNVKLAKGGFQDDIFGTGESRLKPWKSSSDTFFFVKEAYDLEGIIDGINVEGNPYIFIAQLKGS